MISRVEMFWTRGTGFVSRRIQSVDWTLWQGKRYPSAINHVGLRFICDCGDDWASESHWGPGVHIIPWNHVCSAEAEGKIEWVYVHPLQLTEHQRIDCWERAKAATGEPYDTARILTYWISRRMTGGRWSPRPAGYLERKFKTCNEHNVSVVHPFVVGISPEDRTLTPEALFQHFIRQPSMVVYQAAMENEHGIDSHADVRGEG